MRHLLARQHSSSLPAEQARARLARQTQPVGMGAALLSLQRTHGNRYVREVIQRQGEGEEKKKAPTKPKFEPVEGEAAEKEYAKKKAEHKAKKKSEEEASFLALDDMFAERVKATGGKRIPGSATRGQPRDKTFLLTGQGLVFAAIDDKSFNCHSFTFHDAKVSKLQDLKKLEKKIPEGPEKGKPYFDAGDLDAKKIHVELGPTPLILPRWVAYPDEVKALLDAFRPRQAGEKLSGTKGDIVMYVGAGDFPHSGKVTQVDGKSGEPKRVKGKWGHYSLFEHDPEAVPAHYGQPSFYRRK